MDTFTNQTPNTPPSSQAVPQDRQKFVDRFRNRRRRRRLFLLAIIVLVIAAYFLLK